jgi:hypothetical protein
MCLVALNATINAAFITLTSSVLRCESTGSERPQNYMAAHAHQLSRATTNPSDLNQ